MTDKKQADLLIALCTVCYVVSYLTRINFGAVVAEMELSAGFARTALSAAVTGSFITYGAGQLLSGFLADRIPPKTLVFAGLLLTGAMNLLIPLCPTETAMLCCWCVNGLAQAMFWPPIVGLLADKLSAEDYARASVTVVRGSSFGTIAIYLLAPLLIRLGSWKSVFAFCGGCALLMSAAWQLRCPGGRLAAPARSTEENSAEKSSERLFSPLLAAILLAIVLQGALRDGVTTWMPTFIAQSFSMGSEAAILSGVVLPLFSILCFQLAFRLYHRRLPHPIKCAGVIFAAGAVCAFLLWTVGTGSPLLSVPLTALLAGCMHGVNLMLISILPPYLARRHGSAAGVSGLLNSCVYIGSALSTYGIALVSERFGWSATLFIWFVIAAAGSAICFGCIKPWNRRYHL
ncbi:MAG: MFS transporter [Oscillospiraceae bacterium]|nr:MFS transporter [Oscillospiraceae bacterium]